MNNELFSNLKDYLAKIPGINQEMETDIADDGIWWIKLRIDIHQDLAWNVVQELGSVINYLSLNERLPACFYPVSPPPYMNGGPEDFLSWIIETKDKDFTPDTLMKWLEGRLPSPGDDPDQWNTK